MITEPGTLTFERMIGAPPAELYRAFTSAPTLRAWLCDTAQVEAHAGGRLSLWWNDGFYANGTFTTLVPGEQIGFSWHGRGEPAPSRVQVALAARAGGTVVSLTHAGIGATAEWAETRARHADGWPLRLESLQSLLETGVDLREARRPILGLAGAEVLTPELAARLGVAASAGIVVGGVMEESGLTAAGLRAGDVIISMDGQAVPDWSRVFDVLQAHQAGDRIAIVYEHAAVQHTAIVELGSRPQPELPPSAAALAEAARAAYAQLRDELAACFAGMSEEAAASRPAPGEWSAKETIAHLIACERDLQAWIAGTLLDIETADYLAARPNVLPRLAALVGVYDTIPRLLDAFGRSADENVALLAALPDAFVQRKHLFRRVSAWPEANLEHGREHVAQLRAVSAG